MRTDFQNAPGPFPQPFDRPRAARTLEDLAKGEGGFAPQGRLADLLQATFGNSPYLARIALRDRASLRGLLESDPHSTLDRIVAETLGAADAPNMAAAMTIFCAGQSSKRRLQSRSPILAGSGPCNRSQQHSPASPMPR